MLKHEWYTLITNPGYEEVVKDKLDGIIKALNLHSKISVVLVPTEEVIVTSGDKKRLVRSKVFPSYVFIRMAMTLDMYGLVMRVKGVKGFLYGADKAPNSIPEKEMRKILCMCGLEGYTDSGKRLAKKFKIKEKVFITEGAFKGFTSKIENINASKGTAIVKLEVFGRESNVSVPLNYLSSFDNKNKGKEVKKEESNLMPINEVRDAINGGTEKTKKVSVPAARNTRSSNKASISGKQNYDQTLKQLAASADDLLF